MEVFKVNRRDFVKLTSVASAGLVLGIKLPGAKADEMKLHALGPFVQIDTVGNVTIYVSKSDMGQGVRTSLPMIVAEELGADWKRVRVVQADLDPKYGRMGTGGSSSVRTMYAPLRQAGATARAMLVAAAATKWAVKPEECDVEDSFITHGGNRANFGEFAEAAAKLDVPKEVKLEDASKFKIVGKKHHRVDNKDLLLGKSGYGIDVKVPGMLYAVVAHAPVFGAKVASFDDTKAKAVRGVKAVLKIDPLDALAPWAGVGVVAESTWAAVKGRDALVIRWDDGPAKTESSDAMFANMRELVTKDSKRVRDSGDVDAAFGAAAKKLEATYELPFLAHATMEPMNCTASVTESAIEIWAPTQFPDWAGGFAARAVGLEPEQAKVHVTLLGGGFGRRAMPDQAVEAAKLSKAVGKPVKLLWTREDDMQHDFYRPASVHRVAAALDANGNVTAWHHRMANTSINAYLKSGDAAESEMFDPEQLPLTVPNIRAEFASVDSAVPRGWWRSVESTFNGFVIQSFIDELAHEAGKDPIEFQLAMFPAGQTRPHKTAKDYPFEADRYRRVIELARDKSDWGKPLPAGRARGFAAFYSFMTYVAEVAEVSIENGTPRVHRVTCVVDCGTAINPDGVAAQMEGGIVYGLTAALNGAITIKGGAVEQSNFHDYPLLTIAQMPVVDVHIVPSTALPTGTGEPGTPPIAPAVANAVFALTGKRVRKLPITV